MNKAEFIDTVAKKTGLSKKDTKATIEVAIESLIETLATQETVSFIGFGAFSTTLRAAREATVPGTKKVVQVPATMIAKFKVGKTLKDAVAAGKGK